MTEIIREDQVKVFIELEGKIYVEDAAFLREKLLSYIAQGKKDFLITMSKVTYIDSSGLGVLVAIQKRVLEQGGEVKLQGLVGPVREIFSLTRLDRVFTIL